MKLADQQQIRGKRLLGDHLICDLEHNPEDVPRCCSNALPCLLTHGLLCSSKHGWRPLLAPGHLLVQGHPLSPVTVENAKTVGEVTFQRTFNIEAAHVSPNQCKRLAGNAQHLATVGSFFLWCQVNVERKGQASVHHSQHVIAHNRALGKGG